MSASVPYNSIYGRVRVGQDPARTHVWAGKGRSVRSHGLFEQGQDRVPANMPHKDYVGGQRARDYKKLREFGKTAVLPYFEVSTQMKTYFTQNGGRKGAKRKYATYGCM